MSYVKLLRGRREEPGNEADMAAYTNPEVSRVWHLRVLEARPSSLPRSQLSSARTVHELGNEASLVTVWTADEFYRQD